MGTLTNKEYRMRLVLQPIIYLAVLVTLLSAFTCHHQALQTSAGVAASLQALQQSEISLHTLGKVSDDEHRLLQEGFKTLYQTDKSVRQCLYTTNAPGCVDSAISAVNAFVSSKANGIKNPDSRQQITLLAQAVITSLNTLRAAI
jgi:hypothetical protein